MNKQNVIAHVLQMEEDGWCNDCLRNADECTFNLMEKDELPLCYQYQKEREKNNGQEKFV